MKTRIPIRGARGGAVATGLVLTIAALMVALVIAGSNTVVRARRTVQATDHAQARHWAGVVPRGP